MATRRGFLAFLTAAVGTLAGCSADTTRQPSRDDTLRTPAASSARMLAAMYEAALERGALDHAMAQSYRGHHLAHVQRLTNSSNNSAPPTEGADANADSTRTALAAAERAASGASAADVNAASADLAALLASVATCRALHAQSLAPTTAVASTDAPPLSATKPASGEPLQALLSAEHAVIFAYGALGPYLTGGQFAAAHVAFDLHRGQRDALVNAIDARGGAPRAAEASYNLPFRVTDATSACRLAALVETRLAAVCAQAVSASSGDDRTYAAWALMHASLRAQAWGAPLTAFPGLDV